MPEEGGMDFLFFMEAATESSSDAAFFVCSSGKSTGFIEVAPCISLVACCALKHSKSKD